MPESNPLNWLFLAILLQSFATLSPKEPRSSHICPPAEQTSLGPTHRSQNLAECDSPFSRQSPNRKTVLGTSKVRAALSRALKKGSVLTASTKKCVVKDEPFSYRPDQCT
jgi:hypothetical protein